MSEHSLHYAIDGFEVTLTMKRDDDGWPEGIIWGRAVEAVMAALREPVVMPVISGAEADNLRADWLRRWKS